VKHIPIYVNDSPKKLANRNKTKLLSSQRMGLENKQLEAIRLEYLVVSFETQ
jgi:hypothetical protein